MCCRDGNLIVVSAFVVVSSSFFMLSAFGVVCLCCCLYLGKQQDRESWYTVKDSLRLQVTNKWVGPQGQVTSS